MKNHKIAIPRYNKRLLTQLSTQQCIPVLTIGNQSTVGWGLFASMEPAGVTEVSKVRLHETYPYQRLRICCRVLLMQQSWADTVWSTMIQGKFYSVSDLSNLTGKPESPVNEAIHFLTKYGFVKRVGSEQPVYARTKITISPAESVKVLKQLVMAKTSTMQAHL